MNNVTTTESPSLSRQLLNKVPEITIFFWIIKVLCTTVGETAADFLNINLNFGLTATSVVTGILLAIALFFQFRSKQYIPSIYWLAVVLISVFGTLVTDNLTDSLGVPLETSTIFFSIALALTFAFWYTKEKTLSIHSIFTRQREAFYWLAILFTFALGTAAGDLMAEGLALGYSLTGVIIAGVVVAVSLAWRFGLNPVLSFWMIYIMTRPLGASLGDYLSQPHKYGGLGWGATITSVVFLTAILAVVVYVSITKRDVIPKTLSKESVIPRQNNFMQVIITTSIFILVAGFGYSWRQSSLQSNATSGTEKVVPTETAVSSSTVDVATKSSSLGDLSSFKTITTDTLNLVQAGKMSDAAARITDFEHDWDASQAKLKRMDVTKWTEIDDATDLVLRQLRSTNPDAGTSASALKALLETLN